PIAGITDDIDGDSRHPTAPTIGADEGSFIQGISNTSNNANSYILSQNYPNPFNPSTTINFSIPKDGFVSLKIYDISGREIATLLNEEINVGMYSVVFNASKLSSGVYFYTINAGSFIETKQMILVK
ncbi:MAG TPA: T9SS type A sorting domain-containing protein, partial [Ignavibacteria bacterium]|nr:T9SS type A sorting domain-containing protein [Ignavibacteria bacterium]